ncbi:MAG: hydantoinase B/oxoprolinase family protein, partial [Chloroflexi bacterium]|nr:hydantoinase B/oxoprolinase family protein [Chloroflexota bacterium]
QTWLAATGHVGTMPSFMQALLREIQPETIAPGDVYISNDPWLQAGHTADVFITVPVFRGEQLLGFTISTVHHLDVGGRSGSGTTEEVYEEGLILPIMRLYRAGEPNADLFRLLRRNVRYSEKVIGDLHAQIAACRVGGQRLVELADEQGLASLEPAADAIIGRTEANMRAGIRALPDGVYRTAIELDQRDEAGRPLRIVLTVTIREDELWADFTGTSLQVRRPINAPIQYAYAYVVVGTKLVCDPNLPNNLGTFRPIHISAPEGCLFNPRFPAPVFWRITSGMLIADLMLQVFGQVVPERVPAQSGSLPTWQFYFWGQRVSGEPFILHQHAFGGMGGRPGKDGLAAVSFPYSVREVSAEGCEIETPLLVERRELIPDSGGAGRWRGGPGEELAIRVAPGADIDLRRPVLFAGAAGRLTNPAVGLLGGRPGRPARILLDGQAVDPAAIGNSPEIRFTTETLTLQLPGGGGYGDPRLRDRARVAWDVKNGYVTADAARALYGLDAEGTG